MKWLVVDHQAVVRDAVVSLIARHRQQVELRHAVRLTEACDWLASQPRVDCVLLAADWPDGAESAGAVYAVRRSAPAAHVVVLAGDAHGRNVSEALAAGARGCIATTDPHELHADLARLLAGDVSVLSASRSQPPHAAAPEGLLGLTPRQIDVLRMLADGDSNKGIARALALSPATVKTHVEAIFQRLHVHSRTQAVVAAARRGLRI